MSFGTSSATAAGHRLGVDVGGTFTDLILIDETTNRLTRVKTPSTPSDPSQAILNGVDRLLAAAEIDASHVTAFMHGTTVATNAILERKGGRVALLVTRGYREILHIARSYIPGGLASWIVWDKPDPLAPLELTIEIDERMSAHGEVLRPLDENDLRHQVSMLRDRSVDSVTVAFVNSYVDDRHERRAAEIVAELLPDVPVSCSAVILPEIREYERAVTTVANAYVRPTVAAYLTNLGNELNRRGVGAKPRVLRSDGGLMAFGSAAEAPVNLLLSGPAGGVSGALAVGAATGYSNLLTLDMGGTSTDVALIQDNRPRLERETTVGDLTVRVSSIDVRTVGAGGGSIAHVPELTGALRVGPESAGAQPGPAAYGQGGEHPTVTDANVVLGYLPQTLLGGEMKLDVEAAREAVQRIATSLGISLEAAAEGVISIVNENMYGALRLVSIEQGYDPREFALIAFGGAGPLHANALGILSGSWPVIVPQSPGLLCAFGAATTHLRTERSRTVLSKVNAIDAEEVTLTLEQLASDAAEELTTEGIAADAVAISYQVSMRYQGQAFELVIEVSPSDWISEGISRVTAAFDAEHRRLFGFDTAIGHELVGVRAVAQGPGMDTPTEPLPVDGGLAAAITETTTIFVGGASLSAPIIDRSRLAAGVDVVGPAVIAEHDSTTLVLPGHRATVHPSGHLFLVPDGWKPESA